MRSSILRRPGRLPGLLLLTLLTAGALSARGYRPHAVGVIQEITGDPRAEGATVLLEGTIANTLGYGKVRLEVDWITGVMHQEGQSVGNLDFSELKVGDALRADFHPYVLAPETPEAPARARANSLTQLRDGVPPPAPVPDEPHFVGVIEGILMAAGHGEPQGGLIRIRVTDDLGNRLPGEVQISAQNGATSFWRWHGANHWETDFSGIWGGQTVHVTLEPQPPGGSLAPPLAEKITVLAPN